MTIKELALSKEVSERTIRRYIIACELDPEGYASNMQGIQTPLYDKLKFDTAMSNLSDSQHFSKLSDESKLKFTIGHIELEGTSDQRDALRAYLDNIHSQLLDERKYSERVWEIAGENNKKLMKQVINDKAREYEGIFKEVRKLRKQLNLDEWTGNKL